MEPEIEWIEYEYLMKRFDGEGLFVADCEGGRRVSREQVEHCQYVCGTFKLRRE